MASGSLDLHVTAFDIVRQHFESLSPRQKDIALLLAEGLTNADIAQRCGVTVHTIKAHRAEVMRRMQAESFAELVTLIRCLYPAVEPPASAHSGPLRILVVEDDRWYREYLTDNLNVRGFSAQGVADAAGFREAWARRPADIVMLDIELGPGQEDGLAIARELRKSSRCGIVMVTARGEVEDRLAGLGVGADVYFSKPVSIAELAIVLTNLGRRLR